MKRLMTIVLIVATISATGCKKKKSGVCYCKYLSGDKKEYDLTGLDRGRAEDSCRTLDGLANGFAGDCELK